MNSDVLSPRIRQLTTLSSVLLALLGAIMFLAPDWATVNFPWRVTPFVTRTMGAWYLGSAVYGWEVLRGQRWSLVYPSLVFLWVFAILEALMPLIHANVLRLDTALAISYLGALGVAVLAAILGGLDILRTCPTLTPEGPRTPWLIRGIIVGFALLVAAIALPLLLGQARGGTIWPNEITLLTARSFGAFYLSLVIADLVTLWSSGLAPTLSYLRGGLALILCITVAGLLHIGEFDFVAKPGGLIYFALYIVAAVGAGAILLYARRSGAVDRQPRMSQAR